MLLEIFKDIKVIVNSGSQFGRYKYPALIIPKENPRRITEIDLFKYCDYLNEKHKEKLEDEKFIVKREKVNGKEYLVLTKVKTNKSTIRIILEKLGIVKEEKPKLNIPIYFDLQNQKFYVKKEEYEENPKLANYIIWRTLGTLGITTVKHGYRGE
jgi:exonuclease I